MTGHKCFTIYRVAHFVLGYYNNNKQDLQVKTYKRLERDITLVDILSNERLEEFVMVRRMVAALVRVFYPKISLKVLGHAMGRRTHSTIINNLNTLNDLMDTTPKVSAAYCTLVAEYKNQQVKNFTNI